MSIETTFSGISSGLESWLSSVDKPGLFLAAIVVAAVIWLRMPIARVIISILNNLMKRLSVGLSQNAREELTVTTSVLMVTLVIYVTAEILNLPDLAGGFVLRVLTSVAVIAVFAGWYNLCGPFVSILSGDSRWKVGVESNWVERVARFGVMMFGIAALLKVWEVDISGALTGVGVLGAGLAIATQDLIRNLVAGMNNMSEKRFSVGDTVQIEGVFVGTVEQIDLRSTLLRGFDQIPRYIPNSELSNAVVLNYSKRSNRRVKLSIPFVFSSTPEQIAGICDGLREHLLNSGDFEASEDAPKYVHVEGLTESAILVMFYAWTTNPDYDDFLRVNERLTMKILELSKQYNAPLAYPTQTHEVHARPD